MKYSLVAEYWQRPRMDEVFRIEADKVRETQQHQLAIGMNNKYFPEWLGILSSGLFIMMSSAQVLSGNLEVGRFLATLSVFHNISTDFADLYKVFLKLTRTMDPLRGLTEFFNMQTDLLCWKGVSSYRMEVMKARAIECVSHGIDRRLNFDKLPIQLTEVVFHYVSHLKHQAEDTELQKMELSPILGSASISVEQGKLVALLGEQDSGKATLLRLLGHTLFPIEGHVFVPPHLRILHVSRDPVLVKGSPWRNLSFGLEDPCITDWWRVRDILTKMRMYKTLCFMEAIESHAPERTALSTSSQPVSARISTRSTRSSHCARHPFLPAGGLCSRMDSSRSSDVCASDVPPASCRSEGSHTTFGQDETLCTEAESDEDKDPSKQSRIHEDWLDVLTYGERVKIHLARAFIMNPEVLVLQRPLHSGDIAELVQGIIREFVDKRGICLSDSTFDKRTLRTCFFSPETKPQLMGADVIWRISQGPSGGTVSELSHDEVEAMDVYDHTGTSGGLGKHRHLLNM